MQDSIFSKIIRGEIPCQKVYEDELTMAFLDIHPKQPGHTLVVPKKQVEYMWDLEPADYAAVMDTVQKVGRRIREVLGSPYVGMAVEGLDVPHAHVHVYPFSTAAEARFVPDKTDAPDDTALEAMAQKLAF